MLKKAIAVLRVAAGLICIYQVLPPVSIGVLNAFVLLPGIIGALLLSWPACAKLLRSVGKKHAGVVMRSVYIIMAAAALFFAVEFCVLYFNSFADKAPSQATLVVLGAQVEGRQPTIILSGRIRAAAVYLERHPQTPCVASGGRGQGESISEGECIRERLVADYGIDPARIFVDSDSLNTKENIVNTLRIIRQHGLSENLVITTDGFHIFRSKMIARRNGLTPYANPAKTDSRLAVYQYLRELFALPKSIFFDR